jgi:predicted methyltransferase
LRNSLIMKKIAHIFVALLLWLGSPVIIPAGAQDYRAILADRERPENERAMDGDRKPEQILKFYGVKAGDRTADLMAGAGYYTAILSQAVGASGVVYSANPSFKAQTQERFHSPRFANVKLLAGEMDKVGLPADHSLDLVLIHLDYHMIAAPARVEMNKRIFNALKPGGIYGVIDHAAKENSGEADRKKLHRIDPQLVRREIGAAGFKLSRETQLLRNPKDAHDQPSHKLDGDSDRFVLAFTKP